MERFNRLTTHFESLKWGILGMLVCWLQFSSAALAGLPMVGGVPVIGWQQDKVLSITLPSDRVDDISVEKISQFIQAYLDVIQLLEARQTELHSDQPLDAPMQTRIEQEALQCIEAAGLTRQEYLQLLNLANSDPDFSDRIAMQLQEFSHD